MPIPFTQVFDYFCYTDGKITTKDHQPIKEINICIPHEAYITSTTIHNVEAIIQALEKNKTVTSFHIEGYRLSQKRSKPLPKPLKKITRLPRLILPKIT